MNKKAVSVQRGSCRCPILLALSVLLVLGGLISTSASAQSGAGSIEGTVADSSGAIVPGALIHVVNVATNVAIDTKSNGAGFFQVPGLFTGTYNLSVSAPGLKVYKTSIELLVAQTAMINPQLTVGAQTEQVIVNANQVQLTTNDSPSLSSTLERERISQLPMNTREITTTLAATTPGLEGGGQNMNGMAPEALDYVIDGAITNNDNDGSTGTTTQTQLLDPDSIQEVHVESGNGSAQYTSPATVVMTTRSGTNSLHGTAFETVRNNAFGVANPRGSVQGAAAPQYIRNEFGVSAGGPVILPHVYHGRDKTFWFFAYERYSLAQQVQGLTSVPTYGAPGSSGVGSGMNNGDFSSLVSAAGVPQVLYNPATTANSTNCAATGGKNPYCRTPFLNNQIPVTEESPFAKIYYQLVPRPNIPGVTNPEVGLNLSYRSPSYSVVSQMTGRIDHVINENNRIAVRGSTISSPANTTGGPRNLPVTSPVAIPVGAALGYTNNISASDTGTLSYTHVFSPTFFAETDYSMQWYSNTKTSGFDPNANYESGLGLPNNFGEVGFPAVTKLITPLKSSQNQNNLNSQIATVLGEDMTKTIGRHQIFFGGRFFHERDNNKPVGLPDTVATGVFTTGIYQTSSGQKYTPVANTGFADASFFLGTPTSYKINLEPPRPHYHINEFDAYTQDNFHFSKNLTFNLGVRYEAHPALWTKYGLNNSFDLKNDAMVLASTPAQLIAEGYTTQAIITNDQNIGMKFETPQEAGLPANTLMNNYDLNFLPRLGAAWLPFGSGTVIRGGYGWYMYHQPLEDYANHPEQNNPFTASVTQDYTAAAQAVDNLPDEQLRYNAPVQFGVMGANSATAVNTNVTNSITPGVTLYGVDKAWKPTVVAETNFTIEQPLPGHSVLRATYLYSHTSNLDVDFDFNNNFSAYQWEMSKGAVAPNGGASVIGTAQQNTYSGTALGPYNNTTYGSAMKYHTKTGWANYNAVQLNYQRLYRHGYAYQIFAVYGKQMSMGGDSGDATGSNGDTIIAPYADYPGARGTVSTMSLESGASTPFVGVAPPALPAGLTDTQDYHAMDRFQGYMMNFMFPRIDIKFNGIYDLPVGHGKWLLRNSPRWLDEIVGGYQIAGLGSVVSQVFQPSPTSYMGPTSPLHVYKKKYKVMDCRGGTCVKSYLWFNGYLSPNVIAGPNCATNCVSGLPADYKPYQTPINNDPTNKTYFGTNTVNITFPGASSPTTSAYDVGPNAANYTSRTYLNGPTNWESDLSLFKVFPIKEQMNLRLNFDAFNAFNHPGTANPDTGQTSVTDGLVTDQTAYNNPAARQLQITARFTF